LSKTASFHTLFIKKKARNGAVLTALWVFFFPWTREAREEEDFSSPAFLLSLPLLNLKKTPTQPPHLLTTWWKKEGDVPLGRFGAAAQRPRRPCTPWTGVVGGLPPLCFTYKYRGGEAEKGDWKRRNKKRGGTKDERDKRTQEWKKERKRNKKQRRERREKEKPRRPPQSLHHDNNTAAAGNTASTPPQVTFYCPVLFPLAQPLPTFACRTWIIHVLQQMVRGLVTVFEHSNQPIWCGPGLA